MIYEMIQNKQLEIKEISKLSDIKLKKMLTDIKGVGSWTADNMLIFFFRRINVFPCEDLIIEKVKTKFEYLEKRKINFQKLYSPYLSVLSLHFWKLSKRIL